MSEPPLVIVSKSEPADYVPKLCAYGLNAMPGEAGTDYVWYPHSQQWGIERKTVSNLLGSLGDRQLVEQTHRGAKQFDRYIILIEGAYKRSNSGLLSYYSPREPRADKEGWVESKWQYAAIAGMLFALQLVGDKQNVIVYNWPVSYDAPAAIASIVHQTSAPEAKFTRERQRPDLPPSAIMGGKLYSDAVWALCALPGVGPEIAEALLSQYGTLAAAIDVLSSSSTERGCPEPKSVKINGRSLGQKRADALREAVNTRFT